METAAEESNQEGCIPLGRLLATPGAIRCMDECGVNAGDLLRRHQHGDWGELSVEDRRENYRAARQGLRILSNYPMPNGERVWIITEADRSATTFLLPTEY